MRRRGSRNDQFRERIPADVIELARGRTVVVEIAGRKFEKRIGLTAAEVTFSLRTPSAVEAKRRHADASSQLKTFYEGLRGLQRPIRLTHEECVRLAGDLFRGWTSTEPNLGMLDDGSGRALNPEQMEAIWRTAAEKFAKTMAGGDNVPKKLQEHSKVSFRRMIEGRLLGKGMAVDAASLDMVCDYAAKALLHGFEVQAKKASGDLQVQGEGERYGEPLREPQAKKGQPTSKGKDGKLSFGDLIEMWRQGMAPAQSTLASYSTVFEKLAQVIGHSDARRLTEDEVEQYKQARLSQEKPRKVSPQTVKGIDVPAIRSVMQWAIDEKHVQGPNPAANVKVRVPRKKALRVGKPRRNEPDAGTGFTDAEAKSILRVATNYTPKSRREKAKTAAAKRWIPWLLAYSGARIGEMAQLRKEDVRRHPEKGFWYVAVEPEAGTTKTADGWTVPLHSHLVDLGFVKFVQSSRQGHLFFDPKPEGQEDPDRPKLQLRPGYEDRWADKRKLKRKRKHARTDDPRGILGPLQGVKNRVAEMVRTVVKEKGVDPNHGWRHRFKPWAIAEGGLQERMVDEIQHHSGSTSDASKVSRAYGQFTLVQKHEAIEKLPRYVLVG